MYWEDLRYLQTWNPQMSGDLMRKLVSDLSQTDPHCLEKLRMMNPNLPGLPWQAGASKQWWEW
jgi:hypothetical protein